MIHDDSLHSGAGKAPSLKVKKSRKKTAGRKTKSGGRAVSKVTSAQKRIKQDAAVKADRSGVRAKKGLGKQFVLDTNVLLHDPECLQRFGDNHVCIPVDVLSELDRFKNEPSERGANARRVHRHLTSLFQDGGKAVTGGVPLDGGGSVRLVVYDPGTADGTCAKVKEFHRVFPALDRVDHRILACTLLIQDKNPGPVILVTKDLNMQLKAKSVGIDCEDYENDKVKPSEVRSYELVRVYVQASDLQRFASSGELSLESNTCEVFAGEDAMSLERLQVNQYVLLQSGEKGTIPARHLGEGKFQKLNFPAALKIPGGRVIKPINLGQQCFLDALLDPEISLVTSDVQAGTGKTLLGVAAGLHDVFGRQYHGLTVSRPVVAMGDSVGFLPGSLEEKMKPWLQPIYDALEVIMRPEPKAAQVPRRKQGKKEAATSEKDSSGAVKKPYDGLLEQGLVEVEALCYIRGRSIPQRFFILDEAQQLTPLEAKTVVTRMSQGSKLVLIGDPAQIDNPYVDSRSNGLVYTRDRMRGQSFAAHVTLSKGERSDLAEAGAKLM